MKTQYMLENVLSYSVKNHITYDIFAGLTLIKVQSRWAINLIYCTPPYFLIYSTPSCTTGHPILSNELAVAKGGWHQTN